jgi:hypothetical protein
MKEAANYEAALWRAGGNRRLNIVSHDVEIDSQLFEKFAFVEVGGQLADEVTILCLNEKLLALGAQVFHSWTTRLRSHEVHNQKGPPLKSKGMERGQYQFLGSRFDMSSVNTPVPQPLLLPHQSEGRKIVGASKNPEGHTNACGKKT